LPSSFRALRAHNLGPLLVEEIIQRFEIGDNMRSDLVKSIIQEQELIINQPEYYIQGA
jgi:hypothetical protein